MEKTQEVKNEVSNEVKEVKEVCECPWCFIQEHSIPKFTINAKLKCFNGKNLVRLVDGDIDFDLISDIEKHIADVISDSHKEMISKGVKGLSMKTDKFYTTIVKKRKTGSIFNYELYYRKY